MRLLLVLALSISVLFSLTMRGNDAQASYFDDENDKKYIVDLRRLAADGKMLAPLERVYLRAAARTGIIDCEDGIGSNGNLIRVKGRDAILTSAHAFVDSVSMNQKCDLNSVKWYPNQSFYDPSQGPPTDFHKRTVKSDGAPPLNFVARERSFQSSVDVTGDWLVFFLSEQVSQEILPDGSVRGFIPLSTSFDQEGIAYLVGTDTGFGDGLTTMYQSCAYSVGASAVYHLCHTQESVSSSALFAVDDGVLALIGIHSASVDTFEKHRMVPVHTYLWNHAVSSSEILKKVPTVAVAEPIAAVSIKDVEL